ncbi:MAG: hypothetical protein ABI855_18630, partial [Bacteroidota bacterium]
TAIAASATTNIWLPLFGNILSTCNVNVKGLNGNIIITVWTKNLVGSGTVSNTFYFSKSFIHHLKISAGIKHYSYDRTFVYVDQNKSDYFFTQVPVDFDFILKQSNARSTIQRKIILRNINIWQDENEYFDTGIGKKFNNYLFYQQTIFDFKNNRTFDPFGLNVVLENGNKYTKIFADLQYKFSYPNIRKGVIVRAYGGMFIYHKTNDAVYNFRLSDFSSTDYLYDDIYSGRSEGTGILSKQTYLRDGGFKVFNFGESDKWLASLNATADFPGKIPLRFFIDAGTYDHANISGQSVSYEGGISLSIIKDVAEIYFPLFKSPNIKNQLNTIADHKYKDEIRFMINFKLMNPFRSRDNLLKQ